MSILSDLYAQIDEYESTLVRTLPEFLALEASAIIPFIKAQRSLNPMDEPTDAITRYNALREERWPAQKLQYIRTEIGSAEAQARTLLFHISECDKEVARMQALPQPDARRAARIKEEIAAVERTKAAHQRKLDRIGTPRWLLSSDSMKAT